MDKKFDFKGSPSISFWKKIRIHPLFTLWRRNVLIFLLFLILIFLSSLIIASSISLYKTKSLYGNQFKNIFSIFNKNEYTVQFLQNYIIDSEKSLSPLIQDFKKALPEADYSYQQKNINNIEQILTNLKQFGESLPSLENSFNHFLENKSFDYFLNYLDKNEGTIIALSNNLEILFEKIENGWLIPSKLKEVVYKIQPFSFILKDISNDIKAIRNILGDNSPHTIIVWLQNSNEKRSTGGFIGSFLKIVMNDGKVDSSTFHDIYEFDGQITEEFKAPNIAKTLVGDKSWSLRDSNYSPIFHESAEAFMKLYEKAGGETVDTIIAIDNNLIENLLEKIDSIKIPEKAIELNSKNFSFILSYIVESKLNNINPKQFLEDSIIPAISKKFFDSISLDIIIKLIGEEKENIQMFSRKDSINKTSQKFRLGKNIEEIFKDDSVIVINQISISGNKSDAFIDQNFAISESFENGKKIVKINIERSHNWSDKNENDIDNLKKTFGKPNIPEYELRRILGQGTNHALFQLFLPENAKNFSIYPEEIKFNSWKENGKIIVEIDSPILTKKEKQEIRFTFYNPQSFTKNSYFLINKK